MNNYLKPYADMTADDLNQELHVLQQEYKDICARNLKLNMARGKPSSAQLDLSMGMLDAVSSRDSYFSEDGTDCRNYGILEGIPEARAFMAHLLDDRSENVVVLGNSSLTIEHDMLAMLLDFGTCGHEPLSCGPRKKWLCPVPGYDRHFSMVEQYDFELIAVPMNENGPDMDIVEQLVAADELIKGIWCVPQYSNPTGVTYSDETVNRLASMKCAAADFRIFWDNAYCVHHLYNDKACQDHVLDIGAACCKAGNDERYLKFASTSKIVFPGAGISAVAACPRVVSEIKSYLSYQMIGADKMNMLRHVRFFSGENSIEAHMAKHSRELLPRFEAVWSAFENELAPLNICEWTRPNGGYFISFTGLPHTAKRTVALAKEAGVILTGAGATWPHGEDPQDNNIRIAPTYPSLVELKEALAVFCCCAKIAAIEAIQNAL